MTQQHKESVVLKAFRLASEDIKDPTKLPGLENDIREVNLRVKTMTEQGLFDLHLSEHIPDNIFRKPFELVK